MSSRNSAFPLLTFVGLALAGIYVLPVGEQHEIAPRVQPAQAAPIPTFDLLDKADSVIVTTDVPITLNRDQLRDGIRLRASSLKDAVKGGRLRLVTASGSVAAETGSLSSIATTTFSWNSVDLTAIANRGEQELFLEWFASDNSLHRSTKSFKIRIDTEGPRLANVRVDSTNPANPVLIVTFADEDLDVSTVTDQTFRVHELLSSSELGVLVAGYTVTPVSANQVHVTVPRFNAVNYRLVIAGKPGVTLNGRNGDTLKDSLGNSAGGGAGLDQSFDFAPTSPPLTGPRVEFPPFLPAEKRPQANRPNPGDHVETRVARLYYFRDAHRVAQIVNRITQSYNRAAVTQAQRRAEDARHKAEGLTDERRAKERAAIESAQATRRIERQLQDAMLQASQLTQKRNQLSQLGEVAGTLTKANVSAAEVQSGEFKNLSPRNADGSPAEPDSTGKVSGTVSGGTILKGQITGGVVSGGQINGAESPMGTITAGTIKGATISSGSFAGTVDKNGKYTGNLGSGSLTGASIENAQVSGRPSTTDIDKKLADLQQSIPQLEAQVAASRSHENKIAEESKQAQAREDRAVEEQFRQDVAAAHEDPDTYAPAKKDSMDPVAQVSISVIGEGLLHLRGPIHGINTIRKMIDQIDTPVGQVKVGINTVQINGEKGDKMENVAGIVEGNIDLARFLTAQSLSMLRKSVQIEAAQIAQMSDEGGHLQVDRDRKYLYNFFGRDFIDELYEMDSEFLRTENKLLSLHSMDTINLNQAMFILALAKNDVRQRILDRFMMMVQSDLPQAEWDFRRSSELYPHKTKAWLPYHDHKHVEDHTLSRVYRNAQQRYHFRSLRGFFEADAAGACGPDGTPLAGAEMGADTMNSTQRTFLRLAQIFKSQLIAEQEVKQRVIERAIIEDNREDSIREEDALRQSRRRRALEARVATDEQQVMMSHQVRQGVIALDEAFAVIADGIEQLRSSKSEVATELKNMVRSKAAPDIEKQRALLERLESRLSDEIEPVLPQTKSIQEALRLARKRARDAQDRLDTQRTESGALALESSLGNFLKAVNEAEIAVEDMLTLLENARNEFSRASNDRDFRWKNALAAYRTLNVAIQTFPDSSRKPLQTALDDAWKAVRTYNDALERSKSLQAMVVETRQPLDHKKLLDHLIDEREEKFIELREGTRSYISAVDNHLKRLAVALEDDFKVQFYDPAFIRIRQASRAEPVTLGQVERTTILMNNRALAIVRPSATMEFDLPKRDIVIVEALEGAKALAQDYGALLNDPTFLAAFQMMGGGKMPAVEKRPYPGLGTTTDEHIMGLSETTPGKSPSSLQSLVPDPAIYKFETGTAFEIRPVIQPDGESIVYDFNYMYTTNVNEPVRADEKHLGRIKRHFIDTQVQTSSYEMREVSRYQVALKAARTSRGVPLFEDIPGVGVLFKPLPSAESSLQQNIILAHSTVYPTLFDLMGLRWAKQVVDLDHESLRDSEHVARGRSQTIEDYVFDKASADVDDFLDIPTKYPNHHRSDLYRQQRKPSPYHPGGFQAPEQVDPTGRDFRKADRRPPEMREEPRYDDRFRRPIEPEEPELIEETSTSRAPKSSLVEEQKLSAARTRTSARELPRERPLPVSRSSSPRGPSTPERQDYAPVINR